MVVSALQFFTAEPLILHAEQFEGGGEGHDHAAAAAVAQAGETVGLNGGALQPAGLVLVHTQGEDGEEWGPADGVEDIELPAESPVTL